MADDAEIYLTGDETDSNLPADLQDKEPSELDRISLYLQLKSWFMIDDAHSRDWREQAKEMMEVAGCRDIETADTQWYPGRDIHEMGGCRMGRDPATSMLNQWNQLHACPNVFVTDGACMTSTGNQSPSLLYMALTARAVNRAVEELGRQNLGAMPSKTSPVARR